MGKFSLCITDSLRIFGTCLTNTTVVVLSMSVKSTILTATSKSVDIPVVHAPGSLFRHGKSFQLPRRPSYIYIYQGPVTLLLWPLGMLGLQSRTGNTFFTTNYQGSMEYQHHPCLRDGTIFPTPSKCQTARSHRHCTRHDTPDRKGYGGKFSHGGKKDTSHHWCHARDVEEGTKMQLSSSAQAQGKFGNRSSLDLYSLLIRTSSVWQKHQTLLPVTDVNELCEARHPTISNRGQCQSWSSRELHGSSRINLWTFFFFIQIPVSRYLS